MLWEYRKIRGEFWACVVREVFIEEVRHDRDLQGCLRAVLAVRKGLSTCLGLDFGLKSLLRNKQMEWKEKSG